MCTAHRNGAACLNPINNDVSLSLIIMVHCGTTF